jgi:hypothetical protein
MGDDFFAKLLHLELLALICAMGGSDISTLE